MNALYLNDKGGQLKTIQGKTSQFTTLLIGLFFFWVGVGGGGEFLGTIIFCRVVDYVSYYFSLRLFSAGNLFSPVTTVCFYRVTTLLSIRIFQFSEQQQPAAAHNSPGQWLSDNPKVCLKKQIWSFATAKNVACVAGAWNIHGYGLEYIFSWLFTLCVICFGFFTFSNSFLISHIDHHAPLRNERH